MQETVSTYASPQSALEPGRNLAWLVVLHGAAPLRRGRIISVPAEQDSFVIEHADKSAEAASRSAEAWTFRAVIEHAKTDNQFYLSVRGAAEPLGATFLQVAGQHEAVQVRQEPMLLRDGAQIRMGSMIFVFKALYTL